MPPTSRASGQKACRPLHLVSQASRRTDHTPTDRGPAGRAQRTAFRRLALLEQTRARARSRSPPGSPCRRSRNAGTRPRRPSAGRRAPRCPTWREVTSGPLRRSRSSIRSTIWSIRGFGTARPARALRMPASTFSRSNGSRSPSRLTHHQADVLDPLVGREPAAAGAALAPSPDGAATHRRDGSRSTRSSSVSHHGQRMTTDRSRWHQMWGGHAARLSAARDVERLPGHEPVAGESFAAPIASTTSRGSWSGADPARDRPERVAGPHHVR